MALMDVLRSAQNGAFFANAGRAAGIGAAAAERTLGELAPKAAAHDGVFRHGTETHDATAAAQHGNRARKDLRRAFGNQSASM